tara:strand:+ start:1002 stop:1223 length:222 start_codon:yes stop_codon:yes gene_type:complete
MKELLKEIYRVVLELKKISEVNNDLLGFICQQVAPNKKLINKDITTEEMMSISLEMSEIFEKYNVSPDEYGLS